jgi:hypothetical protein
MYVCIWIVYRAFTQCLLEGNKKKGHMHAHTQSGQFQQVEEACANNSTFSICWKFCVVEEEEEEDDDEREKRVLLVLGLMY